MNGAYSESEYLCFFHVLDVELIRSNASCKFVGKRSDDDSRCGSLQSIVPFECQRLRSNWDVSSRCAYLQLHGKCAEANVNKSEQSATRDNAVKSARPFKTATPWQTSKGGPHSTAWNPHAKGFIPNYRSKRVPDDHCSERDPRNPAGSNATPPQPSARAKPVKRGQHGSKREIDDAKAKYNQKLCEELEKKNREIEEVKRKKAAIKKRESLRAASALKREREVADESRKQAASLASAMEGSGVYCYFHISTTTSSQKSSQAVVPCLCVNHCRRNDTLYM
jgi:hypothetical protein